MDYTKLDITDSEIKIIYDKLYPFVKTIFKTHGNGRPFAEIKKYEGGKGKTWFDAIETQIFGSYNTDKYCIKYNVSERFSSFGDHRYGDSMRLNRLVSKELIFLDKKEKWPFLAMFGDWQIDMYSTLYIKIGNNTFNILYKKLTLDEKFKILLKK